MAIETETIWNSRQTAEVTAKHKAQRQMYQSWPEHCQLDAYVGCSWHNVIPADRAVKLQTAHGTNTHNTSY